MKIFCITVGAFLILSSHGIAQVGNRAVKQNALSLEIGKTGLIYNLRYDRLLQGDKFGFIASAGSNFGKYISYYSAGGGF
jgi:hypothetical protein